MDDIVVNSRNGSPRAGSAAAAEIGQASHGGTSPRGAATPSHAKVWDEL